MMDLQQLKQDLIRHEGMLLFAYHCTAGKLTIGVGRNLDDRGISEQEALLLLDNDIAMVCDELNRTVPWWQEMPRAQQRALLNMCFNMGWPRLSQFKNMLNALQRRDYARASAEALNSRWAEQVGNRAKDIAKMLKEV